MRNNFTLLFCLACLSLKVYAVDEKNISPQQVDIWNHITLSTLNEIEKDLASWSREAHNGEYPSYDVRTYISSDKSTIFYEFSLVGIEDIYAIYSVSSEDGVSVISKCWVSAFNNPLLKRRDK